MYMLMLEDLENQIYGYYSALRTHNIIENVPQIHNHFLIWLHRHTGWSTSYGWAKTIQERHNSLDEQIEVFFGFADTYRKQKPETVFEKTPEKKENTEKYPVKAEIIQYTPEPLHFFRFYYSSRTEDSWLLINPDGSHDTVLEYAKSTLNEDIKNR